MTPTNGESHRNSYEENATHFAVMAIEAAAAKSNITPMEMRRRLERVNLIDRLLYGQYEVMHSQSLEHVAEDIVTALHNWEKRYDIEQSPGAFPKL